MKKDKIFLKKVYLSSVEGPNRKGRPLGRWEDKLCRIELSSTDAFLMTRKKIQVIYRHYDLIFLLGFSSVYRVFTSLKLDSWNSTIDSLILFFKRKVEMSAVSNGITH